MCCGLWGHKHDLEIEKQKEVTEGNLWIFERRSSNVNRRNQNQIHNFVVGINYHFLYLFFFFKNKVVYPPDKEPVMKKVLKIFNRNQKNLSCEEIC